MQLNIPIYMIVGTEDKSSPVLGLEYVLLEFIRLRKTNLTYDSCIGCNHFLTSQEGDQSIEHFDAYFDKILNWIEQN